jgi:subtilisin
MKFENANELNTYINSNYKKINITGIDMENLEISIDGEITKNKQYAFIKFSDEKAYMQYKNQHDIAGIDYLKVVSHQIDLEEFYILINSKKVAYIEFIEIVEEIEAGELTYTDTTVGWAFDRANIGLAWERGYTGAGIKALIVDNGFHNIPGELEFVDVYGEDDLTKSHGTQVASCLGAKMNNTGLVGVAPDIELYGFVTGGGTINHILPEFINYIIDNDIRIVNFSVVVPATSPSQTVIDAFEYLDSLGVLVFASMGNFGQNFPSSLYWNVPTTIGVGGILLDSNNNLEISTGATGATNNANCDYLFSYGTNILTSSGTVTQAQGTSFSTPAIAGMFALLMQEFPSATRKQLMDIMNFNGEKVDNYYGIFPKYGSHTEMLVEIYPPDWDLNLKVYPVTLSSGVIEKGNKLFVDQEEREYLENVKGKDFIELIEDALGYIPLPISGGTLENYSEKLTTVSASGGSIDLSLGNVFVHTPNGNRTYSITNAVNGQAHSFTLIINMGSTVRTLIFPSSVKWQGGEIPDLTTPNKTYVLTFMTVDGGTNWLGMFGGEF